MPRRNSTTQQQQQRAAIARHPNANLGDESDESSFDSPGRNENATEYDLDYTSEAGTFAPGRSSTIRRPQHSPERRTRQQQSPETPRRTTRSQAENVTPQSQMRSRQATTGRNAATRSRQQQLTETPRRASPERMGRGGAPVTRSRPQEPTETPRRASPERMGRGGAPVTRSRPQELTETPRRASPEPRGARGRAVPRSEPQQPAEKPRQEMQRSGTARGANRRKQLNPQQRDRRFWKEVHALANSNKFMIPRLPFARVVREILVNHNNYEPFRITYEALEALQTAAEIYTTQRLQDAYLLTLHTGRKTLFVKDMELLQFLKNA